MKITVGRLKTIINEELELFQEKHLEPGDPGHDEDYEEKYGDMETHEEILSRLEDILKTWEEKEYDSDKDRWEEYYKDIEELVGEFREELKDEPEDDDDEEEPKKNDREVITGEKENSLEEVIKKEIANMMSEEESYKKKFEPKLDESKDHPGKTCNEAHDDDDISHADYVKSKKKGPSAKIKLSAKQEKKMDTDKDGDIDAKDMKNLRAKKKGKEKPKSEKKSEKKEDKPKKSGGSKTSKNFPYQEDNMMAAAKAFIDQNLERFMSKKLLVWLTTTGLLLADKVDSEQWVIIATAYVGTQGFVDVVGRFKGKQMKLLMENWRKLLKEDWKVKGDVDYTPMVSQEGPAEEPEESTMELLNQLENLIGKLKDSLTPSPEAISAEE